MANHSLTHSFERRDILLIIAYAAAVLVQELSEVQSNYKHNIWGIQHEKA